MLVRIRSMLQPQVGVFADYSKSYKGDAIIS